MKNEKFKMMNNFELLTLEFYNVKFLTSKF